MSKKFILSSFAIYSSVIVLLSIFMIMFNEDPVIKEGISELYKNIAIEKKDIIDDGKNIRINIEIKNSLNKPIIIDKLKLIIPNTVDEKIEIEAIKHVKGYYDIKGKASMELTFSFSKKLMEVIKDVEHFQVYYYAEVYKYNIGDVFFGKKTGFGETHYIDVSSLNLSK
ncbi:MAG: hypothetical protein ACRC7N_00725 [Clostridium sp.]